MTILHVNKYFGMGSGVEVYMQDLMAHQVAAGHTVHVFSTRSPNNTPSPDASRFVERFDYARSEGAMRDAQKAMAFLWNKEAERAMEQAIQDFHPDVIHLHNIYHHLSTSILKPIRAHRIPCVQTLHDYKLACPNYKMYTEDAICERCKGGRYLEAVKHRCLFPTTAGNMLAALEMGMSKFTQSYEKTVGLFLASSEFIRNKMIEWGEPPSKIDVVTNVTNMPATVGSREGNYILAAARLSTEKGFEYLIRAAARVPEVKIKIAGTGPEESRLKVLAQSLDAVNVEFVGFQRQDELREIRRKAQAFVITSVWYENAPFAVIEAMADGLPIISHRVGGLPELVEDGYNGLLVESKNIEQLATALKRVAFGIECDPVKMAENSRTKAMTKYNWDGHLKMIDAAYARVMKR